MKYLVTYEVRSEGKTHTGQIEYHAQQEPNSNDEALLKAAREDSVRFVRSGLAGMSITSIVSAS